MKQPLERLVSPDRHSPTPTTIFLPEFRHTAIPSRRGLIGNGGCTPMKRLIVLVAALSAIPSGVAWAQNVGGGVFPPNEVDQIKVEMAIEKGIKYLKSVNASHMTGGKEGARKMTHRELVLFTYVHSDVPETDPDFKALFDDMIKDKLEATYCVALQAMVLEEVERV